jgi:hypothetical protein
MLEPAMKVTSGLCLPIARQSMCRMQNRIRVTHQSSLATFNVNSCRPSGALE